MVSALHVLHEQPPQILTGGERYPTRLVHALNAAGADARLAVLCRGHEFHDGSDPGGRPGGLKALARAIKAVDVVHLYSFNTAAYDVVVPLSRTLGRPVVLTDLGAGTLSPGRALGRTRLRLLSGLAPLTTWSAFNDLRWHRDRPCVVLYGGGDHLVSDAPPAPPLGEMAMDFLIVGRILPHKGLHVAIEALPAGARLRIMGPRASSDADYLQHLRDLPSRGDVEFALDASDAALAEAYRRTRFTVSASVASYGRKTYARPELLGLTILESGFLGTPAAGSSIGGSGELLARLGMPTAPAGDKLAWRDLLETLFTMPTHDYAALKDAVERDRYFYTWDRVGADALRLYANVLGERGGEH